MDIAYIYYSVKVLLDLYKAKKHSNPTKSAFSFKLLIKKSYFRLEISNRKNY